jgi:hypothetical protein
MTAICCWFSTGSAAACTRLTRVPGRCDEHRPRSPDRRFAACRGQKHGRHLHAVLPRPREAQRDRRCRREVQGQSRHHARPPEVPTGAASRPGRFFSRQADRHGLAVEGEQAGGKSKIASVVMLTGFTSDVYRASVPVAFRRAIEGRNHVRVQESAACSTATPICASRSAVDTRVNTGTGLGDRTAIEQALTDTRGVGSPKCGFRQLYVQGRIWAGLRPGLTGWLFSASRVSSKVCADIAPLFFSGAWRSLRALASSSSADTWLTLASAHRVARRDFACSEWPGGRRRRRFDLL